MDTRKILRRLQEIHELAKEAEAYVEAGEYDEVFSLLDDIGTTATRAKALIPGAPKEG